MEHVGEGNIYFVWCTWNGPQGFGEETGEIGNQSKNQDHRYKNITRII